MTAILPDDPIDDPVDDTPPGYWERVWQYISDDENYWIW